MASPENKRVSLATRERNAKRADIREARRIAAKKSRNKSKELLSLLDAVQRVHVYLALNKETKEPMSYNSLRTLFNSLNIPIIEEIFGHAIQDSISEGTTKALESRK